MLRNNNEVAYLFGKSDINGDGGVIPEITLVKNVSQLSQAWNYSRAEGDTYIEHTRKRLYLLCFLYR